MNRTVYIEIPLHVTGFWFSIEEDDPLYTGSLGAGINLSPGLIVKPCSEPYICYGNSKLSFKTFDDAFKISGYRKIGLEFEGDNLLGLGFGLSAGYTLAATMLSGILHEHNPTWFEVGRYVHVSEVLNKTGYGDVIALLTGGLEYRISPGAPGIGLADKIPVKTKVNIAVSIVGSMTTPEMLTKYGRKVGEYGPKIYSKFSRNPSFERFIESSYEFSRRIGMLNDDLDGEIKNALKDFIGRGCVYGYHRKKNLLLVYYDPSCEEVYDVLRNLWPSKRYNIDNCGIRIV